MAVPVSDRVYAHRLRKEADGLRQVNVWVPADQVEAVRQFAAELVVDHYAQGRQVPQEPSQGRQVPQEPSQGRQVPQDDNLPPLPPAPAYRYAFRFAVKPPQETRQWLKKMGCIYNSERNWWIAKVPGHEDASAEKYLLSIGAEILSHDPTWC